MSTGVADPRIDSNEYGPNPNVSVFEWLNTRAGFAGKVEVFATWATFPDIFNRQRSQLPIRAGTTLIDARRSQPARQAAQRALSNTTRLEGDDPYDSFLHVVVDDHLASHVPRVLFLGYGDADIFQHMGRYDSFLETAHSFDSYMADLWRGCRRCRRTRTRRRSSSRPITAGAAARATGAITAPIQGRRRISGSRSSGRTRRRSVSAAISGRDAIAARRDDCGIGWRGFPRLRASRGAIDLNAFEAPAK